ncbi:hypothetical protein [Brooklawnia sp.]|uniref:hypothetical protein n=1 Tax=Brooklawnia sp. TaxID=2699740 RepID=UPI00311FF603
MTAIVHRSAADVSVQIFVPQGWPERVQPPSTPGWEASATHWLLGCCPPDFREYTVLHRHPAVLARFAADSVEAQIRATRQRRLDDQPSLLDDEAEELHLLATRKAIALVEEALRGKIFIRRAVG